MMGGPALGGTRPAASSWGRTAGYTAGVALGTLVLLLLLLPSLGAPVAYPPSSVRSPRLPSAAPPSTALSLVGASGGGAEGAAPALPSTTLNGIDVSVWQGSINWGAVAGNGVKFAFARAVASYGSPDSTFSSNMQNGAAAGVYMGAYDFVYPAYEGAAADANYFVSVIGPYIKTGYMYPALDLEQDCGTLSVSQMSSWVVTWGDTVESDISSSYGFQMVPTIYMNSNYANNCVDSSVTQFRLWIAEYCGGCSPNTGVFSGWNYYQWTSSGSEPGISGAVDLDEFNGGLSQLQSGFIFGGGGPVASYAVLDKTTGSSLFCGSSFNAGDTIQFTASVVGGTAPYTYAWSFGDGGSAGGNPATHVYATPGTVNPTLVVTDSNGRTGSSGSGCNFTVKGLTLSMTIYDLTTTAAISCGGKVNTLDTLRFTGTVSGGTAPYTYAWDFGDGTTGSGNPVNHVYTAIANVNPTLKVTDANGLSATTGQGCTLQVVGTPVTFHTIPSTVGTITLGTQNYTDGQTVDLPGGVTFPLSGSAPVGYLFNGWSSTGSVSLGSLVLPSTTLAVTGSSAATVTVSFVTRTAITFVSSPAGDASAEIGGMVYTSGQTVTASVGTPYPLLAQPDQGWVFVEWQVSGTGITVADPYQSWTNVTVVSTAPATLTEVVLYDVPQAPLGIHVTGATSSTLTLAWSPPPGALTGYSLGYAQGSSAPSGSPAGFQLASLGAGGDGYTLSGLSAGTEYWLALAGENGTGRGAWSAWVPGTTLSLPQAPLYLTVGQVGSSWAVLSWEPPVGGSSISSFAINCTGVVSSSGGVSAQSREISDIPPTSTVYNVTGLTVGGSYGCTIRSVAGPYTSAPSNQVSLKLLTVPGGSGTRSPLSGLWTWTVSPLHLLAEIAVVAAAALLLLWATRRRRIRPQGIATGADTGRIDEGREGEAGGKAEEATPSIHEESVDPQLQGFTGSSAAAATGPAPVGEMPSPAPDDLPPADRPGPPPELDLFGNPPVGP